MLKIEAFQGEYRWLSNFWPALVALDGHEYPTVEHAYVAAKTTDENIRAKIRSVERPGEVKRLGRGLQLRPDWDEVKLATMVDLTRQKYQHAELQARLLATGDAEIVEGNTWGDVFWGVCRGRGANHLGRIIMETRAQIRAQSAPIARPT
jgi:N-glycosidase YbiA